jgi:hypothetical protein
MGRPPVGKRAMTGAERVRRHREAKKEEKVRTEPSAKFRYSEDVTKQAQAEAEIEALRARLAQATQERNQAAEKNATLREEVAALKWQLAETRARPDIVLLEGEVARLRDQCDGLCSQYLRALDAHAGFMTREEFNALAFWVHPDHAPDKSDKDAIQRYTKAAAILNACKDLMLKREERVASPSKTSKTNHVADLDARMRATKERRRAERAARKAARSKPGPAKPKALR